MSPRSQEYLQSAKRHLRAARVLLDDGISENAAGEAYFAMLNAARAALSEEEAAARSHGGVWHLFHERFVEAGRVAPELQAAAVRARELREDSDYRAGGATPEEADGAVAAATRFVEAIEALLG